MFEATLVGKAPQCWIRDVVDKFPATVGIMDVKPAGEEGVQELFEIHVSPELVDPLMVDLQRKNYVSEVEYIRPKNGTVYGSAKIRGRPVCRAFIDSRCFLISEKSLPDSMMEWKVRGAGDAFKDLMRRLEDEGYQVQVKNISDLNEEKPLTRRQEEMLEVALKQGYFDFPRRSNLHQLAEEVGVKPATLSEVLRRAQRKAIAQYLRNLREDT